MKRRPRPEWTWAYGKHWPPGELERARSMAIEITTADVKLIDDLARHYEERYLDDYDRMPHGLDRQYRNLARNLYQRAGAAAVTQASPQGVPLTLAEITAVEALRDDIQRYTGLHGGGGRSPMLDKADDLIGRLHFAAGVARAASALGGITVLHGPGPGTWTAGEDVQAVLPSQAQDGAR